ncbi:hypothetical protein PIB30_032591, partial [Stylosanthes scabra]|nr:hypothetical protein [Stylosanthes scabra]
AFLAFTSQLYGATKVQRRIIASRYNSNIPSYFTFYRNHDRTFSRRKLASVKWYETHTLNLVTLGLPARAHLGNYNFCRRYSPSISSAHSKSGRNGQTVAEQRTVAKNRKSLKQTITGDELHLKNI